MLSILVIVIVLLAGFIFSIRPIEKFSKRTNETISLKEMVRKELLDSVANMLINTTKDVSFELFEQDVNHIIANKTSDKLSDWNIDSIHGTIRNGQVYFYLDTKLFSLIPTQLIVKTKLTIEDNVLYIHINKVNIGRLPVFKSIALDMLDKKVDTLTIDRTNSTLAFPINLPKALSVKEFEVSDRIYFKLDISIKSADDLFELMKYLGEKLLK